MSGRVAVAFVRHWRACVRPAGHSLVVDAHEVEALVVA